MCITLLVCMNSMLPVAVVFGGIGQVLPSVVSSLRHTFIHPHATTCFRVFARFVPCIYYFQNVDVCFSMCVCIVFVTIVFVSSPDGRTNANIDDDRGQ